MNPDQRVVAMAARIADGSAIDWSASDSSVGTASDPALIANLKAIAALADLHRGPERGGLGSVVGTWGPLTIIEPIGQGRFGQVYRASDPRLARQVALKLLQVDASSAAAEPTRAIEEARLLARVRHPNVLTVHGAECIDGRVGIWTELIDGKTLHDFAAEGGTLLPDEVAAIGRDLASALAAVHEAGLLHRDVKAQNVMREPGGRIVLMDFGTSHDSEVAARRPGDLSGTPLYLAPEIFAGAPPSAASDQYALAVLLFRLLTNQYPVPGGTLAEVREGHSERRTIRLRVLRPDVPDWLADAIDRGLAHEPAQRFPTARDFNRALDIEARRRQAAARTSRLWTMAAASIVVLAGIGLWFGLGAGRTPNRVIPQQLTSVGDASRAVVTRDGKSVLYVRSGAPRHGFGFAFRASVELPKTVSATEEIWVHALRSNASVDRRLWSAVTDERIAALTPTPDGQAVDILIHGNKQSFSLWRLPLDGGTLRLIAPRGTSPGGAPTTPPGWSPDARQMAYVLGGRVDGRPWHKLVVANADGSAPETIVETQYAYFLALGWSRSPINRPAWSPDGRTIALAGSQLDGDQPYSSVVLVDVATGRYREVGRIDQPSLAQPEFFEVAWLDEDRLLVNRNTPVRDGDYSVWMFDRRRDAFTPITADLAGYEGVSLTGGGQVVTTRISSGLFSVWIGDVSGGAMSLAIRDSVRQPRVGGVSNRGDVFFRATTPDGYAIQVLEAGRASPRQLGPGQAVALAPTQDHLVVLRDASRALYRMTVDGSELVRIVDGMADGPSITPDGAHALFFSRKGRVNGLWIVPIRGHVPARQISPHDMSVTDSQVLEDGRLIFEGSSKGPPSQYVCTLPDCADLRKVPPEMTWNHPRPDALASRCPGKITRDTSGNFWLSAASGAAPRQLTHFAAGAISSARFSADCSRFVVVESVPATSDIVLLSGVK